MEINEDIKILEEAIQVSEELREQLSKVKIKIYGGKSPKLVEAVKNIFGEEYIDSKGDSYISYDMYCSVINLIRNLGDLTAGENIK